MNLEQNNEPTTVGFTHGANGEVVDDHVTPFPSLPVELVCHIMEITARGDKPTAVSLVCVSRVVRKWVNPVIYHTVVLEDLSRTSSLANITTNPGAFHEGLGVNIRRLIIRLPESTSKLVEVLRACPNLNSLITHCVPKPGQVDRSSWPTPWHVILVDNAPLDLTLKAPPLLQNTTHLGVDLINSLIIGILTALPRLTHLGWIIRDDDDSNDDDDDIMNENPSLIRRILHSLPNLNVLVVVAPSQNLAASPTVESVWGDIAQVEDRRLFIRPRMTAVDYTAVEEGGGTMWDDVELKYKDWRTRCTSKMLEYSA